MTAVPDYVPMLTKGIGSTPKDGGCLVQIANWLQNPELWTDDAICVDRILATWAIKINDLVDEDHRRLLALLAPRLGGTAPTTRGDELSTAIALHEWMRENQPPVCAETQRVDLWYANGCDMQFHTKLVIHPDAQPKAVEWLTGLIDAHDRHTGRDTVPLLTEEQGRILCEVMGQ